MRFQTPATKNARARLSGDQDGAAAAPSVALSRLDVPVSVAHGKRDRVVPFRMGLETYESAKRKGKLLIVEQAGHNDMGEVAGNEYWKWVTAALALQR